MAKNLMAKTRPSDKPYLTFQSPDGTWTWKVLKSWQGDDSKPFARWFTDVSTPYTYPGSDLGDTYVKDVVENAILVSYDEDTFPDGPNLTIPFRIM